MNRRLLGAADPLLAQLDPLLPLRGIPANQIPGPLKTLAKTSWGVIIDLSMNPSESHPDLTADAQAAAYLTLGINVRGLRCLVVGAGRVGARKVLTLAKAGADVTVVAPVVSDSLTSVIAAGQVQWRQREFASADLDGCFLVVAATSDRELNQRIGQEADSRRVLSCVASDAGDSRVIFPALYDDGEVSVAVHSHGRDCRRSQQVRNDLAARLKQREPPAAG
jgi:siroheme synthase-like protein